MYTTVNRLIFSLPFIFLGFGMSTQSQLPVQHPKRILIQQLDDVTQTICNDLRKTGRRVKESSFSAIHSKRVNPRALVKRLEEFNDLCESKKLKGDIRAIIQNIGHLHHRGVTKMFVCHDNEEDGSKLEFVCGIVYVYRFEGGEACGKCSTCKACKEAQNCDSCRYCKACQTPLSCKQCKKCKAGEKCTDSIACGTCAACRKCKDFVSCGRCEECRKCEASVVCDYLLSTYSYKEKINRAGVGLGIGMTTGGVIAAGGATLALCLATGGLGFFILGGIAVASGVGMTVGGGVVIYKSTDTNIQAKFKNILEASFVHELMGRAFAEVENGQLYLKLDD